MKTKSSRLYPWYVLLGKGQHCSFLDTLLAEHDAAGARAHLKTLWITHVRAVLQVDDEAPPEAPGAGGAGVRYRAPIARGGLAPGVQPETNYAHITVVDCG